MYSLQEFFGVLDGIAPIKYSVMQIEQEGAYDNSGILVKMHDRVNRALFSLDLSTFAVERAKRLKCDSVVTHHPAIYLPVKALDITGDTAAVALAVKYGMNVISMHLNLDVAKGGIDDSLYAGLGGKECRFLNGLDEFAHYGREFKVDKTLAEFKKHINKELGSQKTLVYGKPNAKTGVVASFCGGGAEFALSYARGGGAADTIVTSDMPHHVLKELTERGKQVIILTHYASENYGFKRFFEAVKEKVFDKVETVYFEDEKFL
ncbi:MAG: Nif3-like dinuclear metal center hexameric protein [Clostridia bacterium]|nr:Nif3-like dinuclear metal center hexameric protein [Clostridia bacterium]